MLVNDVRLSKVGHTHVGAEVTAATTSARGTVALASQAEADAGSNTAKAMTPKSVRDRGYAPWAMASGALLTVLVVRSRSLSRLADSRSNQGWWQRLSITRTCV